MIAELAIANTAFQTIKTAIANGREIASIGNQIAQFAGAQDDLRKKVNRRKNSALGGDHETMEEFLALEELKNKEDELRSMCHLYARAGFWDDYVRFRTQARKERAAAKQRQAAFKRNVLEYTALAVLCASILGLATFLLWSYVNR